MASHDGAHDEETESGALDLCQGAMGDTVKTFEYPFQVVRRNANTTVAHAQDQALTFRHEADIDVDILPGILHRIIYNVEHCCVELVDIADDAGALAVQRGGVEPDGVCRQVVAFTRQIDTFVHQCGEVHLLAGKRGVLMAGAARLQDLFNRGQQTIAVEQHEPVEVLTLGFTDFAPLQSFQIEADGSDWCFQFVGDGVDKAVVLLVTPDLSNQKDGVQYEAGCDSAEEDEAQENLQAFPPVENDPAKTDGGCKGRQTNAEREKEGNGFSSAGNAHLGILGDYDNGWQSWPRIFTDAHGSDASNPC